ncbi:unnamed protein product [Urochloa humidicola]
MEAHPQSAAYPRWVMLEQYLEIINVSSGSTTDDDARTLAYARTRNGHPIHVSLRLAEPPALSRVFLRIPDGLSEEKSKVLAAHDDSVLIQVRIIEKDQERYTTEHFVYNAARRLPSLWLLPPVYQYWSGSDLVSRELRHDCTGLVRRGEDDFVVAEIRERSSLSKDTPKVAEVYLFRSGKWNRYHFKISREDWDLPSLWWHTVVPVEYRLLCWVNLCYGVMLLDVFKETPTVRHVQLPMDPRDGLNRNVCATGGGGTLKFVNIFSRCCCGAAASCNCEHCGHAYTIHTWTMRIRNNGRVVDWVKDGMVDATELWALDAYKGFPCDPIDRPIVSIAEPEVICFRLRDNKCDNRGMIWQILVNVRSKTINSVCRHKEDLGYCYTRDKLIPSKVSDFFNTYPDGGRSDDATLTGQSQVDIEMSPSVVVDHVQPKDSKSTLQPADRYVQATSDISEALQEIPRYGLGPDEVKAYRILSSNNGRRLRSLLRLPKNLRKDWLLIEIKASED